MTKRKRKSKPPRRKKERMKVVITQGNDLTPEELERFVNTPPIEVSVRPSSRSEALPIRARARGAWRPPLTLALDGSRRTATRSAYESVVASATTNERERAKAAVEQQLATTRRAKLELFRQSHTLLQEVLETVCEHWSDAEDDATRLGADGLEEAAQEVAREVDAFVVANLALVERIGSPEKGGERAAAVRHTAQEAFAAVLAVGQQLKVGLIHGLPVPSNVDLALTAVDHVLDGLAPFVSRADLAMRRVILDGETIDMATRTTMMS